MNPTAIMRGIVRAVLLCAAVLLAGIFALCGLTNRALFIRLAMLWPAIVLRIIGIRVRAQPYNDKCKREHEPAPSTRGVLLLANHISWTDTLVIGASWQVIFLGNSEVARLPILGWVFARAGTLFIRRGQGASQARIDITRALQRGKNVVLFPEGRTAEGAQLRKFHPRLLQAAIDADAAVQPIALRYIDANGARVTRHSLAGNATMSQSVWATLCGDKIIADALLLPPLAQPARNRNRQQLADDAQHAIQTVLNQQALDASPLSIQ